MPSTVCHDGGLCLSFKVSLNKSRCLPLLSVPCLLRCAGPKKVRYIVRKNGFAFRGDLRRKSFSNSLSVRKLSSFVDPSNACLSK